MVKSGRNFPRSPKSLPHPSLPLSCKARLHAGRLSPRANRQTTGFRPGKAEGLIYLTSSNGGTGIGTGSSMDTENNRDRDNNRDHTGTRNNMCAVAGGIPYGRLCLEKK